MTSMIDPEGLPQAPQPEQAAQPQQALTPANPANPAQPAQLAPQQQIPRQFQPPKWSVPKFDEEEELRKLVGWVDDFEEATAQARELSERDRDYYDGSQWTDEEISILEKRGQPVITINRIAPKVDAMIGVEIKTRRDPKAFPRNGRHDEKAAEAATDALRFVADNTYMNRIVSEIHKNLVIEGAGGIAVWVKKVRDQLEVALDHVPWDRMVWDHHSRKKDFSDSKLLGSVAWMDLSDAKEMYPDHEELLEEGFRENNDLWGSTFDDKPNYGRWVQGNRKRVKISQLFYRRVLEVERDGQEPQKVLGWAMATYTRSGFLIEPMASPFMDDNEEPEPGFLFASAKIDRDLNRYGVVRPLISPQDEINKRRSKALHLMSVRQTMGDVDAVADVRGMKSELAKPDGHVEVRPGLNFQILDNNDMTQAQFQLLGEAKSEIDAIGANAAMTGKDPRSQSGRALQQRTQGGFLELEGLADEMRDLKLRTYRAIWHRIKQFWTGERWVRITDNEANTRFVGFNRPVTAGEALQLAGQIPKEIPPEQFKQPEFQRVVGVENSVAELDVDIILEEGPDLATMQQEQFESLVNLRRSGADIPIDMIVEMAPGLRNKEQILKRLRTGGLTEEEQAQSQQKQQVVEQLQLQGVQAELAEKAAKTKKLESEALENMVQAEVMAGQNKEFLQ